MALINMKNFDSQYDNHIQSILKSGVILDEDMDCILQNYHQGDEYCAESRFSLIQKIIGGISLTSTIFIVHQGFPSYFVPISTSPLLCIGIQQLRESLHRRAQRRNFEILIQMIRANSKLNRMICEYFKLRNMNSPATANIMNPYTKIMKQLMEVIFKQEVHVLHGFRTIVRQLGTYVHSLKSDYAYLENIELIEFNTQNINGINDCVTYLQKLCDIYVLVSSNVLTCLAITLCPDIWAKYDINVDEILDTIVPRMKRMTVACYNNVNKKFDDVKYYYLNRRQQKLQNKENNKITVYNSTSKLYQGTCNMMVNTSEILEKSQIIYKKLLEHNVQTLIEKERLAKCIAELRSQVFDYYESLDVLHKLYEVDINHSKPPALFHQEISESSSVSSAISLEAKCDASLNSTEPIEDEEYELYIGANDPPSDVTSISSYEEQEGRKYASLLSQELKYKLKNHSQFIAARQKRGIIDEEPDVAAKKVPAKNKAELEEETINFAQACLDDLIPKLPLPISIPKPLPNCDDFSPRNLVPPPPPPPLAPIDFGPYGDMAGTPYTVDDFLESIKNASKNRKIGEEVFQSCDDEE